MTPTAPLTTAAEMAREWLRSWFMPNAGVPGCSRLESLTETLTTYAAQRPQWMPIESAPKGRKLLLGYTNSLGKWRTVTGCFYATGSLDWHDGLEQNEGCPEWPPEDWYEESETHEEVLPLTGGQAPTHWQPLPSPPGSPSSQTDTGDK